MKRWPNALPETGGPSEIRLIGSGAFAGYYWPVTILEQRKSYLRISWKGESAYFLCTSLFSVVDGLPFKRRNLDESHWRIDPDDLRSVRAGLGLEEVSA